MRFVGLDEDEDGNEELVMGDSVLSVISVAMERKEVKGNRSYKERGILLCGAILRSDTI